MKVQPISQHKESMWNEKGIEESMWKFQGSIRKEVEFPGVCSRKTPWGMTVEFPWVLVFDLLSFDFQGVSHNFAEFPR